MALENLGLTPGLIALLLILIAIILILIFVFIYLGILAFSIGGTFGAIINTMLALGIFIIFLLSNFNKIYF